MNNKATNLLKEIVDNFSEQQRITIPIKNPTKDFYEFKVEDFEIQDYDYNKDIKLGKIPVAI